MEGVLGSRSSDLAKRMGGTMKLWDARSVENAWKKDWYIPYPKTSMDTQNDGLHGKGGLRLKIWSFFGIYVRFLGCMIFFKGGSLNKLKQTPAKFVFWTTGLQAFIIYVEKKTKICWGFQNPLGVVGWIFRFDCQHLTSSMGILRGPTPPRPPKFTQEIRPLWRDYESAWWIWPY